MYKIKILESKHSLYVDPEDEKGASLIQYRGVSQPRVVHLWRLMASRLQPDLILDAGVNYGEIILSASYPDHSCIKVIDANDALRPYMLRSMREHPNGKQFQYIHAVVSDNTFHSITFYVDKVRSGNSSAYPLSENDYYEVKVPSVTVDSLFTNVDIAGKTLLFKLDVEGYEWQALRGMSQLLKHCGEAAGCIEFNMNYLDKKGVNIGAFLEFLGEHFLIYALGHQGKLTEIKAPYLEQAKDYFLQDPSCNDLILLSNAQLFNKLQS